ncbi:4'-phosphopantetheinyl transferase family protein [Flavobacterium sp.]|uniref:4'-phosphopantetheinyl transferase family protein n=1 Tax=Flavobacterium sp. TaxID=239 RepID=UPI0038FC4AA2
MPLFKSIYIDPSSQILVWEITESFEELFGQVQLNEKSLERLNGMKSQLHQRAFLSVRMLLKEAGYSDFDLYYDEFGKPHLLDKKHVSISHSHTFSTLVISNQKVGIDIEMQREKIIRIAQKFCDAEFIFLSRSFGTENKEEYIQKLTTIWGAKEAIFKIRNVEGISFKNHIRVDEFNIDDKKTKATLELENTKQEFDIYFDAIESSEHEPIKQKFVLVYAFENNSKSI